MDPISLIMGSAFGIGATAALRHTREHRREPAGLADLLAWAFLVDDGVVLQKDGALLAGFRYHGPDLSGATGAELDALHAQLNDAMLPYTDGWMFHADAIRAPAPVFPTNVFPNDVTAWIEAERRSAFQSSRPQFVSEYVLTLTYVPPRELYTRAGRVFVRGSEKGMAWDEVLSGFGAALDAFERRLSTRLRLERLGSDALVRHLHRCLTSLAHDVTAPPHGAYLDTLLASQEMVGGFAPTIGTKHLRLVAMGGYPAASTPGRLDFLNALALPYRWSNRFVALGTQTAQALIRRHQRRWFMGRRGVSDFLRDLSAGAEGGAATSRRSHADALFEDRDATDMAQDAGDALAANAAGAVRFGLATQVIVLADDDDRRVEAHASAVIAALQDHGFAARLERVNAMDAFFGTLPGHGHPNLRRPVLSTANVVDLWPVTSAWPGLPHNPSPFFPAESPPLTHVATDGSTPFRLNLHVSDLGHTLVVGAPGAGKSTLVGLVVAQWQRYVDSARANTFVFDVGHSHWLLAKATGATHFDIGMDTGANSGHPLAFQPLAAVDDVTERAWAANWLELLIELQGVAVNARQRARIERALELLAAESRRFRTLTELVVQLQDRALADALAPYTIAGAYGRLLDASADAIDDRVGGTTADYQHQVFELRQLLDLDDKILVPVLLYLFHRVERALDGRPTLIVIEELWAPLMRSVFANRIKQWLLTLRKQNAAVVLVAHSLAQLDAVPAKQVLLESCATRILLPNADATSHANRLLYRDLGLNDREIALIAGATPKRDYYVRSPLGNRLIQLELGPVALAFLGTPPGLTTDAMRPAVETLAAREGAEWPRAWLRQLGIGPPVEARRASTLELHEAVLSVSRARSGIEQQNR